MGRIWHEWMKSRKFRDCLTFAAVVASGMIQAYGIQTFVLPAGILSGGFSGLGILIEKISLTMGHHVSLSLILLFLNVPVALACCRGISVRFTFFSLINVFCASFFLKVCNFQPMFDDVILNVIFGGFILGIGVVITLLGEASTGGTDFIALYVSNKVGKSIWEEVFLGNVVVLCVYGYLYGWENAGYSIVFQFIITKTISTFHHRYERLTVQIITARGDAVVDGYIEQIKHGITRTKGTGGYSKEPVDILYTIVSSYEVQDIARLVRDIDPAAIINVLRTDQFYGYFLQKPME